MGSKKSWIFKDIFLPFVITRCILVFVGYLARYVVPPNPTQLPEVVTRGWLFTSNVFIDMWARWDSGWYLSVINNGYSMGESVYVTSNLAFFPVFPQIVKTVATFMSVGPLTVDTIFFAGILVSNVLFFAALVLLFVITRDWFKSEDVARKVVLLMLVFPTSFFFSSFYTESTFLFFSLLSFWAAGTKRWWLACVSAAVVGATRPMGVVIGVPLLLMYLEVRKWQLKKLDTSVLWFAVVPVGLIAFFLYLYSVTGDFFAAMKVQNAWGRKLTDPFTTFFFPTGSWPLITPIDQFWLAGFLISAFSLMKEKMKSSFALGLYAILLVIPSLFTGTIDSASRYMVVLFPVFMYWAYLLSNKKVFWFVAVLFLIAQMTLFAYFRQYHWVG